MTVFYRKTSNQAWWHTATIPALMRVRQLNFEFDANIGTQATPPNNKNHSGFPPESKAMGTSSDFFPDFEEIANMEDSGYHFPEHGSENCPPRMSS